MVHKINVNHVLLLLLIDKTHTTKIQYGGLLVTISSSLQIYFQYILQFSLLLLKIMFLIHLKKWVILQNF